MRRYSEEEKQQILKLKQEGLSSRKIAKELDRSKSGINDFLASQAIAKAVSSQVKPEDIIVSSSINKGTMPKVLLYDLEVGASTVLAFGRFKQNISLDAVVKQGGHILCLSYMWLDDKEPSYLYLTEQELEQEDDHRLVKKMYELYSLADAVICHNSKNYDHKVLQARALKHGLCKLPLVKVIDTLLMSKNHLRLPSYSLDSVADYFGLGRKIQTGGMSLWRQVQHSRCPNKMQEMVDYCKQDVILLRGVYLALRCLGRGGDFLNANLYTQPERTCPVCGSDNITTTGRMVSTLVKTYPEYSCGCCGYRGKGDYKNERKVM